MSTARISAAAFRAAHARAATGKARITVAPKDQRTYDGRVFGSKGEAAFAQRLDLWRSVGIVRDWEPQFRVPLLAHRVGGASLVDGAPLSFHGATLIFDSQGMEVGTYVVDFRVQLRDMILVFFEVKPPHSRRSGGGLGYGHGVQDIAVWKMRHFRAQHPEWPLVVVSWKRDRLALWPDTSLEELHLLAAAGLVLERAT